MNDSLDVAKCEGNLLFLNIALAFLLSDVRLEFPALCRWPLKHDQAVQSYPLH